MPARVNAGRQRRRWPESVRRSAHEIRQSILQSVSLPTQASGVCAQSAVGSQRT